MEIVDYYDTFLSDTIHEKNKAFVVVLFFFLTYRTHEFILEVT